MNRVHLYSVYERVWHWTQAAAIVALLWTGLEMHFAALRVMGFGTAVKVHNVLGFVLAGNAFLGLFYHLTTGHIRQYIPEPTDFFTLAFRQARYYLGGYFRGEPHPFERRPERKLNPLQKITYLVILNVLLPLQMASGLLMWGSQQWPGLLARFGGLRGMAMVHSLGAWLFAAFLIMHVYLTTTGRTPLALIRAMVVGYDTLESPRQAHQAGDRSHELTA